mmetsp:Transcript_8380/g.25188  ORF Transcript_8380/g.25188 Transcript_8380/m.25188 type:complete len:673 (+) Transcript_8380:84-2102(+)
MRVAGFVGTIGSARWGGRVVAIGGTQGRRAEARRAPCARSRVVRCCVEAEVDGAANKGVDSEEDDVFVLEQEDEGDDVGLVLSTPKLFRVPSVEDNEIKKPIRFTDLALLLSLVAIVYGFVTASVSVISGPYVPAAVSTNISALPWYTMLSTTRIFLGYLLSLVFAIVYAYCAYRVQFAAKALVLVIDILQSIPLLSFLPGVVLGLMALFPGQRVGVELAAMLLLFTSMAWNMVLGFYQSLCSIPRELLEASSVFRISSWKRFWTLELPAGAVGLVWNSIVSIAGGWFFLISIESFELGNQDFRLPGIGAFLAQAAETANYGAIWWGLASLIFVIVLADFLIWRPLIAWSSKFTYGSGHTTNAPKSAVLSFVQRSQVLRAAHDKLFGPLWAAFVELFPKKEKKLVPVTYTRTKKRSTKAWLFNKVVSIAFVVTFFGATGFAGYKAVKVLSVLSLRTWFSLVVDALYTSGRVVLALVLSMIWTVPLGVAIGRDARLAAKLQPLVQVVASVPATALFPFVLLALARMGSGLQIGSVALMMLGTMWYVLFNVIAGAQAIPAEFFEVDKIYGRKNIVKRWRTLLLPGIFPYLITGVVTAVGGAWNASIVSEYVVFQGEVLSTKGLGAVISRAAAAGDYSLLLAGTLVMCTLVLLTNRFVWGPLYRLAETKYKIIQS